jgi:hypothetical protein
MCVDHFRRGEDQLSPSQISSRLFRTSRRIINRWGRTLDLLFDCLKWIHYITNLDSCRDNGHDIHIRFAPSQFSVLEANLTSVVKTAASFPHRLITGINSFHEFLVRFRSLHRICANFRAGLFQVHREMAWNEFCKDAMCSQILRQISGTWSCESSYVCRLSSCR